MRTSTAFDPRAITHVWPTLRGFMLAYGQVFHPNGQETTWVPGVGNENNVYDVVWEGPLRVQANIDWRARARNFGGEFDATMATRISLPMHENRIGMVDGIYGPDPKFALGDVVVVTDVNGPGQRTLLDKRYTVRNALPSTNMWEHDLLCDVGTSLHG